MTMHIWTNLHFGLVKSPEILNRIKPDHHSIFPSQKIQLWPPTVLPRKQLSEYYSNLQFKMSKALMSHSQGWISHEFQAWRRTELGDRIHTLPDIIFKNWRFVSYFCKIWIRSPNSDWIQTRYSWLIQPWE